MVKKSPAIFLIIICILSVDCTSRKWTNGSILTREWHLA